MANRYVRNVTRNCFIKLNQAEHAVEMCAAVWVERGVSIRDLTTETLSEAIAARNERAKRLDLERVLAYVELPRVVYQPDVIADMQASRELVQSAEWFASYMRNAMEMCAKPAEAVGR